MGDRIERVAVELLDRTDGVRHLELISQFAYPLPVTIIAQMLGVPVADRRSFKIWADALLDRSLEPGDERAQIESARANLRQFHDYMRTQVGRRHSRLRKDLLSDLVTAEIGEARLTDAEIVGFATLLLLAGHITTTLLLGNAVLCLDEYPDAQIALRADSSAIAPALEETLRYRSPIGMTRRVTTREVELGGACIGLRSAHRADGGLRRIRLDAAGNRTPLENRRAHNRDWLAVRRGARYDRDTPWRHDAFRSVGK